MGDDAIKVEAAGARFTLDDIAGPQSEAKSSGGAVIEIRDAGTKYTVTGTTHVHRKSKVIFFNTSGADVSIQFVNKSLFGHNEIKKLKHGFFKQLKVKEDAGLGTYAFSAYCHGQNQFAEGNSMPIIIVDPDQRGVS